MALWVVLLLLLAGTLARADIAATNKMADVRGTKHERALLLQIGVADYLVRQERQLEEQ